MLEKKIPFNLLIIKISPYFLTLFLIPAHPHK